MNKADLIDAIASKAGVTKAVAAATTDAFLESVTETLADGGSVMLVGFGNFTVSERAERTGRNPQTGAEVQIPAAKVGVEQAVVSPTAISITAGRAWCSCRGRTAHTD